MSFQNDGNFSGMNVYQNISDQIRAFIPGESTDIVVRWIVDHKIFLTITQKRNSILGDYRRPHAGKGHRISVNGDMNCYSFLVTLVHEVAHLSTWVKYQDTVSSHGKEWKQEFKLLMDEFSGRRIFPGDIRDAVKKYLVNPAATHCSDPALMQVLNRYDKKPATYVQDLDHHSLFQWNDGKIFKKGEKVRTRYKCYEVKTNRIYLFSPMAEVKMIG